MDKSAATGQDMIAIVGMAGRFPGAGNVDGFWTNLVTGVESIRTFTDAELDAAGATRSAPGFVPRGSVMDGVELFDAPFFGMSPREAELTDPQHRVFLECAWTALEHAGYDPATFAGRIGVYGGVSPNTYFRNNVAGHRDLLARIGDFPQVIASEREHAVTRVAYKLGLRGPAVSISTASSTSAVATHLAIGSLLLGECDMAIAGGCRIRIPTTAGYIYEDDGIVSPDGHCRPFDADARGTVLASGVALVVLKRLQDAVDDGDTIYALIRGSAINNDGHDKIGYTAPSIEGQSAVIAEALDVAQVDVETIGMVEAHGTGTSLGDPIEVDGPDTRIPAPDGAASVRRHWLAQIERRPHRRRSGCGRDHQGRPLAAPRADPADDQLHVAQSPDRLREQSLLRQHRAASLAANRHAAEGDRQLVRARRHQRPPRPRGGAARPSVGEPAPDRPSS